MLVVSPRPLPHTQNPKTPRRQERVETSGPLGSAPSSNPHLDVVESELAAAAAQGLADGFTAYLGALLEIER